MDYEKKYNEALKRAKKIHSQILNNELIGFPGQIETIFPGLRESERTKELRFCIEYINPRFPILNNGGLNVRHLRVPNEHWAEMAITLILSFGGKIYALYRGNVKDGKLADWPTPMIVDSEDWFSDEWLHELIDCGHNCL